MRQLAFLFPGQGSQYVGMLADTTQHQIVQRTVEEASDVLGYGVGEIMQDELRLSETVYTQPALLTASIALLRLWRENAGLEATAVAGHSLGEYAALVAAKVLTFAETLELVAFRGKVMTEAVATLDGKMAAVLGLERDAIDQLCASISTSHAKVWTANDNCPGQIVVAGHAVAVEKFIQEAQQAGARRVVELNVSVPSHTPLMQPAADAMAQKMSELTFQQASYPVWSNALAQPMQAPDMMRAALVEQLIQPVRWSESIQAMLNGGIDTVIEMGSGKVLTGLMRRIDRKTLALHTDQPAQLLKTLAKVGDSIE